MTMRQIIAKIDRQSTKLLKEKYKLKNEFTKISINAEHGFFKSTYEINKLRLELKKTNLQNRIVQVELQSKILHFEYQGVRHNFNMIQRAEKLINQMKQYKEFLSSKNKNDFEERKILYYKLYGLCESLKITINFADSLFRTTSFESNIEEYLDNDMDDNKYLDNNQKYLITMIKKIDSNLISNENYLDIIQFEENEVFENSLEVDENQDWLNW